MLGKKRNRKNLRKTFEESLLFLWEGPVTQNLYKQFLELDHDQRSLKGIDSDLFWPDILTRENFSYLLIVNPE